MSKKLEGKVAIITGGASGIGAATARSFAEHGARAVVIADVQEEKGIQVSESIKCDATDAAFIKCDVTDEEQVKHLVKSTVEKYGQLNIFFSNAGVLSKSLQDIFTFDLSACDQLFSVNVRGSAACVKHAARAMVDIGGGGSIICTASMMASCGSSAKIDYAMSKHAVVGLVRCASKALGVHGIRVNCVSPGPVATPLTCGGMGMSAAEFERRFEGDFTIKGSGSLKAEHVADAVVFLASDESKFMTGHDLVVDGGFVPSRA